MSRIVRPPLFGWSEAPRSICMRPFQPGLRLSGGPLHGGANQAVIEMLSDIAASKNMDRAIERAKDKSDSFRLMGFGHRVYKTFDPRMKIMKKICDTLLEKLNISDPLLDIAVELEQIALKDDYFIEHHLYPNVDFYSGIVMRAIGIPTNMFTVMFAIGRLPGWIAQWKESQDDPKWKLCRPPARFTRDRPKPITSLLGKGKCWADYVESCNKGVRCQVSGAQIQNI